MRHGRTLNHLGRDCANREALLKNLAKALILKKHIFTTIAKAKALRRYVEPILTKSKDDSMNSRRVIFSKIQDKVVLKELFNNVSDSLKGRDGGYTRIIKIDNRFGDNATMCMIELVDFGLKK